jgi:monovalent cation/hydrogen antiporter
LLNDALALVLYETAVHVTQIRTYVWGSVSLGFCLAAAGGIAISLAIGWLMLRLRRLASDPLVGNTIALLTGLAAYLPADALHVSGALAVVTAGLYRSWKDPGTMSAKTRLQSIATWEVITFLLNGLLFILMGLQLRTIVESLSPGSLRSIIRGCVLVRATVFLVRILWVFISTYVPRAFSRRLSDRDPYPPWQQPVLISWVGIRGGISAAAALAIPKSLADGSPFTGHNEILILTFAVILATLVLQGLSLPWLLRRLNFGVQRAERAEEYRAREALTLVAIRYLASAAKGDAIHQRAVKQLQNAYRHRAEGFEIARKAFPDNPEAQYMARLTSLERKLIGIKRTTLFDLRDHGAISDDVLGRFQVLLDLEESQLEEEERRWSV